MNGKKLMVIGGASVLAVGIVGASTAFAHPKGDGAQPRQAIVNSVAGVLDMDQKDLIAELRSGKTLAEIALENGVEVDDVLEHLVDEAGERLDTAVVNGNLTEDEAADKLFSVEGRITELLDKVLPMGRNIGQMMRHRGGHSIINTASDELGLAKRELMEQLRSGNTIAGLAAEDGVSTDAIIDTVVAGASKGLSKAVENGAITQEKADERLAMIEEKVTEAMDKAWFANQEERGQHGRGYGFGKDNNRGLGAWEGGQRHSGDDNPGVSFRQSRGFSGGESSGLQGFGGGPLQWLLYAGSVEHSLKDHKRHSRDETRNFVPTIFVE